MKFRGGRTNLFPSLCNLGDTTAGSSKDLEFSAVSEFSVSTGTGLIFDREIRA